LLQFLQHCGRCCCDERGSAAPVHAVQQ
jgi:hypothetical protein